MSTSNTANGSNLFRSDASDSASASFTPKIPLGFDDEAKEKKGIAWFQDDTLYFSPNSKHPVEVPPFHPPEWEPQVNELNLDFFFTPQWYRGRPYAWLCMVPRAVAECQNGSVFEVLKDHNLPTSAEEIGRNRYIIPLDLQQRWKSFEERIGAVLGAMIDYSNIETAQVYSMPIPERMGGYTRVHTSERVALRQAYQSRQWFLVYVGTLIYSCMRGWSLKATREGKQINYHPTDFPSAQMTSSEQIEPLKFLPVWFIRVAAVHPNLVPFLSLLRFTFSNFLSYVSHVGMFFRIKDILALGSLGFFIRHRVPICYPWGDDEEDYVRRHPSAACYRPPLSLIQDAIVRKQQEADAERVEHPNDGGNFDSFTSDFMDANSYFDHPDFFRDPLPSTAFDPDRPPTPSSLGSGHDADFYSMQDFHMIRRGASGHRERAETPEARQERLLKRQVPTRNTELYYWRLNSIGKMIRLRIASRWRAVLEAPGSKYQRRYDQWHNCVDYAEDFDPKPSSSSTAPDTLRSVDLMRLDHQIRETYRRRIPEMEGPELDEEDWRYDSAINIASLRFGFVVSQDETGQTQAEADIMYRRIHECLQLFRDSSAALVCPADVFPSVGTLYNFVNAFKPQQREDGELESDALQGPGLSLWDVHPNASELRSSQAFKDLVQLDQTHTLLSSPEGCSWSFVATNHVDALHACRLRERGFTIRQVALHFLDRGIPFRAMVPSASLPAFHQQFHRLRPSAIEVRLEGYVWTRADYDEYCRLRRATLLRPGVGFSAFQHGGIVWRIAREELGKLPVSTFETGPDLTGAIEISDDLAGWVDNRLSNETVAAICGVYHIPFIPQAELQRLSASPAHSLLEQLLMSYDVQGQSLALRTVPPATQPAQGSRSDSRASVRFAPYPAPSGGPSARNLGFGSVSRQNTYTPSNLAISAPKRHPLGRFSWFPTPDTLSAARKGNLGHWTGRMEEMWVKRINEITAHCGVPKSSTGWADMTFGSMGKHLWRAVAAASDLVMK